MTRLVLVLSVAAACGNNNNNNPDAKMFKDAPGGTATVQTVSCTGATISATFMETDGVFMISPTSATITQGQIVKLVSSSTHDYVPGHSPSDSSIADPGLNVGFSMTACLMFTHSGSFGTHCANHPSMNATITVN